MELKTFIKQAIKKIHEGNAGLSTGFEGLDKKTHGLQPSELTILAGRPSMGKSAMMLDMALALAVAGKKVAIFSMEMSNQLLAERLLANRGSVNLQRIKSDSLTPEEATKLNKAYSELGKMQIDIFDRTLLAPLRIEGEISQHKYDCIFVDYLQLLSSDGAQASRYQEIDAHCKELKDMAKKHNIPVVALAQLGREVEKRTTHEPRLSDLRESGGIEQVADLILLLHRPSHYALHDLNEDKEDDGEAFIFIAKNRNGPTGRVKCGWIGEIMSFREIPTEFKEFGE